MQCPSGLIALRGLPRRRGGTGGVSAAASAALRGLPEPRRGGAGGEAEGGETEGGTLPVCFS